MKRELITPRQYAESLDIPYPTVMAWIQRGRLPARRVEHPTGHYYLIRAGTPPPRDRRFKANGKAARKRGGA
jgi:excisionase family DNA binding protein